MTQEEINILEGNKIIAEYLGFKKREYLWWTPILLTGIYPKTIFEGDNTHNLKFHNSWNWIIPVVQHISKIKIEGGKYSENIEFTISFNDNESTGWIFWMKNRPGDQNQPQSYPIGENLNMIVFNAVVEFIKWNTKIINL